MGINGANHKNMQFELFQEPERIQYLNIISPPEDLKFRVTRIKQDLIDRFGPYLSDHSTAHITINSFFLSPEREGRVYGEISRFVKCLNPFEVRLNGFGSFESNKTIYARIENQIEFNPLCARFNIFRKLNYFRQNFHPSSTPHLTIATRLDSTVYDQIREEFSNRKIKYSFKAKKLTCLKRNRESLNYELFDEFTFG